MDDSPDIVPLALFQNCVRIDPTSAERADTTLQNFVAFGRPWYFDATLSCQACAVEFQFPASEQRHWYEVRKFYVDSYPRLRHDCRHQKNVRKLYDAQISMALESDDVSLKRTVLDLINAIEEQVAELPDAIVLNKKRLERQLNIKREH